MKYAVALVRIEEGYAASCPGVLVAGSHGIETGVSAQPTFAGDIENDYNGFVGRQILAAARCASPQMIKTVAA